MGKAAVSHERSAAFHFGAPLLDRALRVATYYTVILVGSITSAFRQPAQTIVGELL